MNFSGVLTFDFDQLCMESIWSNTLKPNTSRTVFVEDVLKRGEISITQSMIKWWWNLFVDEEFAL